MPRSHLSLSTVVLVVALFGVASADAAPRDYSKLTCADFLASGQTNMAPLIMWLRGYHAGKSGHVAFDPSDPYAARLGSYCGSHRADNLLDTSERILGELDRGI